MPAPLIRPGAAASFMLPSYTAVFRPMALDATCPRPVVLFTVMATPVAACAGEASSTAGTTVRDAINAKADVRAVRWFRCARSCLIGTKVLLSARLSARTARKFLSVCRATFSARVVSALVSVNGPVRDTGPRSEAGSREAWSPPSPRRESARNERNFRGRSGLPHHDLRRYQAHAAGREAGELGERERDGSLAEFLRGHSHGGELWHGL